MIQCRTFMSSSAVTALTRGVSLLMRAQALDSGYARLLPSPGNTARSDFGLRLYSSALTLAMLAKIGALR
jgi:hypothetical protein